MSRTPARPPGARHARLRRRDRPRGARHPARAARRRVRVGDLRRDRRSAARGPARSTIARWSGAIDPDDILIHHFSIGSRASRTAYALPGRMVLVYHNITPPEYFVGVHKDLVKLCFRGRRELTAYIERCDLALGDSEYNRQELEALGFPRTGVLPVVPDFTHLDGAPDTMLAARLRRRVDERPVRRPGDPEQEVRERHPRVPRLPHAAQPALAAAARRLLQRLRALPVRCCRSSSRGSARPTCTSSGTSRTRS